MLDGKQLGLVCTNASCSDESWSEARGNPIVAMQWRGLAANDAPAARTAPEIPDAVTQTIVGDSPGMVALRREVARIARTPVTIFVRGETGTGKELVARAIHAASGRAAGPFVAINCGAIPEHLQESELFGHERGAFTGAAGRHHGVFERADKGTLFLDEVGELSRAAQVRLLRVLQEGAVQRVGSEQARRVEVRVVSATHRDLSADVEAGRFREDLFFRLVVYPLVVPPLRERSADVSLLLDTLLHRHAMRMQLPVPAVAQGLLDRLAGYEWPGNVRQLENVAQRLLLTGKAVVGPDDVTLLAPVTTRCDSSTVAPRGPSEREALLAALEAARWNVRAAAEALGIGRATIYRRMAKHGISRARVA